jgi:NAD(P)-dependent dehydrogenase (short-subunit alcohol dehydrogenase family)
VYKEKQTGGASGIGLSSASLLAKEGAKVESRTLTLRVQKQLLNISGIRAEKLPASF